jgi:hypothetical protein
MIQTFMQGVSIILRVLMVVGEAGNRRRPFLAERCLFGWCRAHSVCDQLACGWADLLAIRRGCRVAVADVGARGGAGTDGAAVWS